MFPYYYPTSILAVDDDPRFLESFRFHFGEDFVCHSFSRPDQAIDFAKQDQSKAETVDYFTVEDDDTWDVSRQENGNQVLVFKASEVSNLIFNKNRFRHISVIVVDYDMPLMNGLDFCRSLKDHPARKIMLTGEASQDTAIKAFNEGVIDCFLFKHRPDITDVLSQEIQKQQDAFFQSLTNPLRLAFSVQLPDFFDDPNVNDVFRHLKSQYDIVEYYASVKPQGSLMVDGNGKAFFMIVMNNVQLRAHYEVAREYGAPSQLVEMLEKGEVLPCFPTDSGFYDETVEDGWKHYLLPSHKVQGKSDWSYAILQTNNIQDMAKGTAITFEEYMSEQDQD